MPLTIRLRTVQTSIGCVLAVLAAAPVHADTLTLAPFKDNTLYESPTGAVSNGAGQHFFAGTSSGAAAIIKRRGLIAFQIAGQVPAGSVIQSVMLTLFMSRTPPGTGDEPISLHRVLRDWGEGESDAPNQEGQGAPAMPGDATWIHTFFNTAFWSTPAGDFDPTSSASEMIGGIGSYSFGSTPGMVADVQSWLDNPSGNHGWLLLGDESVTRTVKRFDTREHPDPAVRPVLTVTYVPEPAAMLPLGASLLLLLRRRSR